MYVITLKPRYQTSYLNDVGAFENRCLGRELTMFWDTTAVALQPGSVTHFISHNSSERWPDHSNIYAGMTSDYIFTFTHTGTDSLIHAITILSMVVMRVWEIGYLIKAIHLQYSYFCKEIIITSCNLPHIVQVFSFKLKVVWRVWWWSGAEQVAKWSKDFEEEL